MLLASQFSAFGLRSVIWGRSRSRSSVVPFAIASDKNAPATGAIILVMQRLHQLDPTGFLLEQEPGVWTHVRIPLEAEEDESWTFPISRRVVQRKAGEVLMPERFPPATVEQLRSRRLVFAGQYQQRPAPIEGNLIKRNEVRSTAASILEPDRQTRSFRKTSTGRSFRWTARSRIWPRATMWHKRSPHIRRHL